MSSIAEVGGTYYKHLFASEAQSRGG